MIQSLTLSAGVSFPTATFLRRSNRTSSVYAAATVAASPVLQRRKPGSFYDVLRVKENASVKEIKAAYRNLAKVYHPDVACRPEEYSDDRNFIEIHEAYATLSDPISRDLYDLKLNLSSRPGGFRSTGDGIRVNGSEFYPTRRWETDQCW
ncbi:chaperone protein dnaJ 11, chloroplastic [Capsicum chacoense]